MNKQTPEAFESAARAQVEKQQASIANNLESIGNIEMRMIAISTSPTHESIAEAVKLKGELLARRSLADDFTRHYRADSEYTKHLNTEEGASVLRAFLTDKTKIVASLRSQIAPLRKSAMEAELAGKDEESFQQAEKAENLAATVADFEGHLSGVDQLLPRFPKQIDSTINYVALRDRLHLIHA